MSRARYDAVLLLAVGGPERMADVRPLLRRASRGQPMSEAHINELAEHYAVIGGRSPINGITAAQTSALSRALADRGVAVPVCFAVRDGAPTVVEVLRALAGEGGRRVLALTLCAHAWEAGDGGYLAALEAARDALGVAVPHVDHLGGWQQHAGVVRAHAENVLSALQSLSEPQRVGARLVFAARSLPVELASERCHVDDVQQLARVVAEAVGVAAYEVCYHGAAASGAQPWLGPDVATSIREHAATGARAIVLSPIGFVSDHIEVLYDLDVEARDVAEEVGVVLARARCVNDHPSFIAALATRVLSELLPVDTSQVA